ncbi:HNH endonuclease [Streptomyces phage Bartholomune]|nr:HNH endonuclease [Streptomyces phage Bartholomune]
MPYTDIEKAREAKRRYYQAHKEKVNQKARDRRSYILQYVQGYKQERGCAECKIMYPYWVLEFDHVRGEKLGNVNTMMRTHSLDAIKAEIEKCDVVCSNCHADRTFQRAFRNTGNSLVVVDPDL